MFDLFKIKKTYYIIGTVITLAIAGIASRFLMKRTDNRIEETAERMIKDRTGCDIDLSPDTPDKI